MRGALERLGVRRLGKGELRAHDEAALVRKLWAPKVEGRTGPGRLCNKVTRIGVHAPRPAPPGMLRRRPKAGGKTRGSENRPEMKGQARATYNNTSEQIDPRGGRPHTKKAAPVLRREAALATPKWAAEGRPRGQQPGEDESVMNWLR